MSASRPAKYEGSGERQLARPTFTVTVTRGAWSLNSMSWNSAGWGELLS